jgi:DNA-binding SARP family transcriptional activator
MIRVLLLGSASLGGDGADYGRVISQPKRLGVLAYLALARPRGLHRRDTLLPLFWPELDQPHARAALRQTLYLLRRALGPGVIVGCGDQEVGLDPARLWCDAVAFENAAGRGRPEAALALYRGDLLAGYHVTQASHAFEEWVEAERTRLRRHAAEAARAAARAAESRGDHRRAAEWVLRELEHSPLDESALRYRLVLLDRTGDRASACAEYEAFAQRLRAQLDVEPSPETEAIVADIRARNAASDEAGGDAVSASGATASPLVGAGGEAELPRSVPPAARVEPRPWRRGRVIGGLAMLPLGAALVWSMAMGGQAAPHGSGANGSAERPDAVHPTAYDLYLQARELASRSVASNAAAIDMLRAAIDAEPAFAEAHAALASAFLHRVQMGAGAEWADSGIAAARRGLELDDKSAEAHRALAASLTWQGRLDEAEQSFRRAAALEPGSAGAALGLGVTLAWQGRLNEALEQYERAYRLQPGNSTVALQIGVVFLGLGDYDHAEHWLTRSLELRPAHPLTLQLLALVDLARGDLAAARERADLLLALDAHHQRSVNTAADVAFLDGRPEEAIRHLERFHTARPDAYAGEVFLSPQLRLGYALLESGEAVRGMTVLRRAEAAALAALERGDQRYSVPLELAAIHATRGQTDRAVEWLQAAVDAGFRMPAFAEAHAPLRALRGEPRFEAAMAAVRDDLRRVEPTIGHRPDPATPGAGIGVQ